MRDLLKKLFKRMDAEEAMEILKKGHQEKLFDKALETAIWSFSIDKNLSEDKNYVIFKRGSGNTAKVSKYEVEAIVGGPVNFF